MGSEALWFFGGALTFQILSRLFRASQLVKMSIEVGASLMVLVSSVHDDVENAVNLKHKNMENSVKDEDLKLLKEVDSAALQVWRESIIYKFKSALPKPVSDIFAFQDWNGAMRFMRKYTRKG